MDSRHETAVDAAAQRREALRRKYWRLGTGELAAAAAFCFAAVTLLDRPVSPALWSALAPLLAVLVQAGIYWLLARRWVKRSTMPAPVAVVYRVLRVANVVLLVAGLAGISVWWPRQPVAAIAVLGVWTFGLVEYCNYFHVRLAYPVNRWFSTVGQWRTSQLVQDMRSAAPLERRL